MILTLLLFKDKTLRLCELGGNVTSSVITLLSKINSSISLKYCNASSDDIRLLLKSKCLTRSWNKLIIASGIRDTF